MTSLDLEIARGDRARQLLQDELLSEAFAVIEKELKDQWQNSPARDADAREKLWLTLKMLGRVQAHLRSVLETGEIARATVAERLGQAFKRLY